jgi:glycosyltransferase involved in cell wall biosynthesis
MKILHVCGKKDWGGGENQLLLLIKGLINDQNEIEQSLLCPFGSDIFKRTKNHDLKIDMYCAKKDINLDPRFLYKIFSIVKKSKIDVIHAHDPDAHSLVILAIDLFRLKTKVILHKKTIFPIKDKKYSVYKYNHSSIKHIICVSEASKNSIISKIKSIPIKVVHDAIEIKPYSKKDALLNSSFTILNIANHTRHKNLFTLLEVANICINEKKLPFKFVQLGSGKLTPSLVEKRDVLNLGNNFEFKGFVQNVEECFFKSDAFIFTSVREGLGVSLLEAIQYKLPIVSSNAGGIPEVIENEIEGLLCDFDDVSSYVENLFKIYQSKELAVTLTSNAFIKIEKKFSITNLVQKTKQIYLSV